MGSEQDREKLSPEAIASIASLSGNREAMSALVAALRKRKACFNPDHDEPYTPEPSPYRDMVPSAPAEAFDSMRVYHEVDEVIRRQQAAQDRWTRTLAGIVAIMLGALAFAAMYRWAFNAGARAHADGKVVVTGSGVKEVERAK